MNKSLFVVISTVMISGLLLGSMGTSVFADVDPETNPGKANGCEKSNQDKGQAKNKNPHCTTNEPGPMPDNECDNDPKDGKLSFSEAGLSQSAIDDIEEDVKAEGGYVIDNGFIDTNDEWDMFVEHVGQFACKLI